MNSRLRVKIKRIDKSLPLPKYETKGSVGFDILARTSAKIKPKTVELISGNIVVKVPKGYGLFLFSRSSTPIKKGLLTPHGVGVLDQDYSGEEDEVKIQVYNFTGKLVKVDKGERIAQGVILPVSIVNWFEVNKMSSKSRGGIGSTG